MQAIIDDVGIVIPTRNTWDLTQNCVDSIRKAEGPRYIVLVDDYSSTSNFTRDIELPYMIYLKPNNGRGFGPAINRGVQYLLDHTRVEYIILLNNDTEIRSIDWISRMKQHFHDYPMVGAIGLGHTQGEYNDQLPEILPTHSYLGFWCFMIRRNTWKEVGPLDPRFEGGYHEDRDWCYRMQDTGYFLLKIHDIDIYHQNNATFDRLGLDKGRIGKENHDKFIEKWGFLE